MWWEKIKLDNWSVKAIRRKTTGTGRMRYLRHVAVRFKYRGRSKKEASFVIVSSFEPLSFQLQASALWVGYEY
ncbi:unnamed protein product [Prunus armeniaca]|uniref:Uncharacterized protein n=1 Tax=Prunus armeniaca TaxID=36596 RepID=A0A6J5Y2S3_PRUAR|nr:unnamed protein product [Prunus armeniaca]